MFWKKESHNTNELFNAQQVFLQNDPNTLVIKIKDINVANKIRELLGAINTHNQLLCEDGMCEWKNVKQYSMDSMISKEKIEMTIHGDIPALLKEFQCVKWLSEQSSHQLQQQFMSKHTETFNDSEKAPLINRVSP